jgi:YD repeat-containing protein
MRAFFLAAVLLSAFSSRAQYYYKDVLGTRESSDIIKTYLKNKVNRVGLTSYDVDNVKSDDFFVQQELIAGQKTLKTTTRSNTGSASILFTYFDENGNVVKTVDSSDIILSTTVYTYDAAGNIATVTSSSSDTTSSQSEQHVWQWTNGKPSKMLKIKNRTDTTFVDFVLDDKGNVSEETETHRKIKSRPIYYYYNDNNQLTDIVRYSDRAQQLLPEYMFEYSTSNQVIQKITVPSNNSDYFIWRYQYNQQGLKTKEVVYSKHDKKNPMGKIEYQYSFSN